MRDQAFVSELEAGVHDRLRQILCRSSLVILMLTAGCASTTLFKSNFDATTNDQPPAHMQEVGTANVDGPAGSVKVIAPPVLPSGKWVQINRPNNPVQLAAFQGNLTQAASAGTYTISTFLFIPSGTGVATVQLESFGQSVTDYQGFLHLDFLQDNRIRLDDDPNTAFGSFPRDQVFIAQVTLHIEAPPATPSADIVISGAGASGEAHRDLSGRARQFGAVRVWMGFPHTGPFDATNIVVTRKQ